MKIKLTEIRIGNRFRQDLGDVIPLCKSIEKNGLLHPIVITEKNERICGRRRIEAFVKLGRTEIETNVIKICISRSR